MPEGICSFFYLIKSREAAVYGFGGIGRCLRYGRSSCRVCNGGLCHRRLGVIGIRFGIANRSGCYGLGARLCFGGFKECFSAAMLAIRFRFVSAALTDTTGQHQHRCRYQKHGYCNSNFIVFVHLMLSSKESENTVFSITQKTIFVKRG